MNLDRSRSFMAQVGRISALKDTFGVIDWITEKSGMPNVRFETRDCPYNCEVGDNIAFSCSWDHGLLMFRAFEMIQLHHSEGIVYNTHDKKGLLVKSGRNRDNYIVPDSEKCPHGVCLRAGDRAQFIPMLTTFLPVPELRAIQVSILATGQIETLVEAPDSVPGRRKYTGCYIKWRQCEDAKGNKPPDDKVFNLFTSDIEARYVLPGMRARVIPILLLKKSMKRLNLTSKFGSFVCMTEGVVSELPDGGSAPSVSVKASNNSVMMGRKREGSFSSVGSASSADLIAVGKVKLAKQQPGASMNFTYADVVSKLSKRALRSGDRVEVRFVPNEAATSIDVSVTLILEGVVRRCGGSQSETPRSDVENADGGLSRDNHDDDFYSNGELEIVCKEETAVGGPTGDVVFPIDPVKDEAVLGFLPLRVGDRVRFHVNADGFAESISVISEIPGRIKMIGTVVLRESTVLASYPQKTFTKLQAGTEVLTRIDWQDTHFRILQMRANPDAIGLHRGVHSNLPDSNALRSNNGSKQQQQQQQQVKKKQQKNNSTKAIPAVALPRPTGGFVDTSPPQPNVQFHGTIPLAMPVAQADSGDSTSSKAGWAAVASKPATPPLNSQQLSVETNKSNSRRSIASASGSNSNNESRQRSNSGGNNSNSSGDRRTRRGGRKARARQQQQQQNQKQKKRNNNGGNKNNANNGNNANASVSEKPKLPDLTAHIAAVVAAADEAAASSAGRFAKKTASRLGSETSDVDDLMDGSGSDYDDEDDEFFDSDGADDDSQASSRTDGSLSSTSRPTTPLGASLESQREEVDRLFSESDEIVSSPRRSVFSQWTHESQQQQSQQRRKDPPPAVSPLFSLLSTGNRATLPIGHRPAQTSEFPSRVNRPPTSLNVPEPASMTVDLSALNSGNRFGYYANLPLPTSVKSPNPASVANSRNEESDVFGLIQRLHESLQTSSAAPKPKSRHSEVSDSSPQTPSAINSAIPNLAPTAGATSFETLNSLLQAIQDHARAAQERLRTSHAPPKLNPSQPAQTPRFPQNLSHPNAIARPMQQPPQPPFWAAVTESNGFNDWRTLPMMQGTSSNPPGSFGEIPTNQRPATESRAAAPSTYSSLGPDANPSYFSSFFSS